MKKQNDDTLQFLIFPHGMVANSVNKEYSVKVLLQTIHTQLRFDEPAMHNSEKKTYLYRLLFLKQSILIDNGLEEDPW